MDLASRPPIPPRRDPDLAKDIECVGRRVQLTSEGEDLLRRSRRLLGDAEALGERARALGCLSKDDVHAERAGEIVTRPWGERSFYADDPWGNGLCFVDEKTLFTGKSRLWPTILGG